MVSWGINAHEFSPRQHFIDFITSRNVIKIKQITYRKIILMTSGNKFYICERPGIGILREGIATL